jgi:predicted metal-binding membrane protein
MMNTWRRAMRTKSDFGWDHKSILWDWADRYMAVWHACMLAVYGGAFLLLKAVGAAPLERTDAYIILGALLIVGAVWQAAGLTLARVHMLLDGVNLEAPDRQPTEFANQQPPDVITGF